MKRYETSQAITRKIDSERQRARDLIAQAEDHKARYKLLRAATNPDDIEARDWHKKQSTKLMRHAELIETSRIPKLSAKLAEFNTMLLPGCGDDRSVSCK